MGGGGEVATESCCTVGEVSRASGALNESDGVYQRQSKCEARGKRGADIAPSGFEAGKQIKGKKRHGLIDTLGWVLQASVPPANRQERDGGSELLTALAARFPLLAKRFAEGAYQGPQFRPGVAKGRPHLATEILTRREQVKGFVALPKRWIVERTLAWLNRGRRLAKDFENRIRYALAFVHLASIRLMSRKLCNRS